MASVFRVFVDAPSREARQRLAIAAGRAGWHVVERPVEADAILSEPDAGRSPPAPTDGRPRAVSAEGGDFQPREALTPREHDVLVLLAEGTGNREIAERLGVSEHTVKFHLSAIFGKLGATTRTEAVRRALRWGWVDF